MEGWYLWRRCCSSCTVCILCVSYRTEGKLFLIARAWISSGSRSCMNPHLLAEASGCLWELTRAVPFKRNWVIKFDGGVGGHGRRGGDIPNICLGLSAFHSTQTLLRCGGIHYAAYRRYLSVVIKKPTRFNLRQLNTFSSISSGYATLCICTVICIIYAAIFYLCVLRWFNL
jgi:hypothetical protein